MTAVRLSATRICDGSGGPPFAGHVVIEEETIVDVVATGPAGSVPPALEGVPPLAELAPGSVLAPGFVDVHSHSDLGLLARPDAPSKLAQGVTSEIVGNCGFSAFPAPDYWLEPLDKYDGTACQSSAGRYLELIGRTGLASNVGTLVGAGSIRARAMGPQSARPASAQDVRTMADMVRQAVDEGALGVSTGLFYRPGSHASPAELGSLLSAAAERGAPFFAIHMRDEGPGLIASLLESIDIARRAGLALHVSHLKAKGRRSWGMLRYALACIADADHPITVDCYPYAASMSSVESLIPPAVREIVVGVELTGSVRRAVLGALHEATVAREGDDAWERIVIAYFPPARELERRTIADVAEERGVSGEEIVLDLAERSGGHAEIINHCMAPENVDAVAMLPFAAVASDGYALHVDNNGSLPHPRSFGTFPRFLRRYVVELGTLELGEAVRKMTSLPAELVGVTKAGRLAPGKRADLVAFDLDELTDEATFEAPSRLASGIEATIVGGRLMHVDERGVREPTGEVLRRS